MQLWLVFALLSALFAALVAIFGKIGIEKIDPTLATTLRAVIMFAMLVGIVLFQKKFSGIGAIDGKAWIFIALSGLAGALSWLFYFRALKLGPVSGVVTIDRLSIAFAVIFAILFLGEKLTLKLALGSVIMIIGALLVAF